MMAATPPIEAMITGTGTIVVHDAGMLCTPEAIFGAGTWSWPSSICVTGKSDDTGRDQFKI